MNVKATHRSLGASRSAPTAQLNAMPSLVRSSALAALIVLGCQRERENTNSNAGWMEIVRTSAIRVALDSSRVTTDSTGTSVWLHFDYPTTNPPMEDMPQPWRQMESHHLLDCNARRAKDLAMIIIDTSGARHDGSHVLSPDWQSFESHPLGKNVLEPTCGALAKLPTRRGA